MEEIWKDIEGYEGYYQISNFGRVRSLDREVVSKNGNLKKLKGSIKKIQIDNQGYYHACLYKNSKSKTYKIHSLVAMAFLNHIPNGYVKIIDHIDGNKLNNNLSNLQIITQRQNKIKSINKKQTTSKYIGVWWCKLNKKWISHIKINNKPVYLGRYDSEYDAHIAYQDKLKTLN